MKSYVLAGLAVIALAGPALADKAESGAKVFAKCKACHSIIKPDGTPVVKGGMVGPNLYGVVGRAAASYEGFNYGDGIKAAAAKGLVWTEEEIADYVKDPTKFLDEYTGDSSLKSKMTFKLPKDGEDVAAYLASVAN